MKPCRFSVAFYPADIAKREVGNFANVQANETIVELQNLDTVDLIYDVPGPDIPALAAREEALVTVAQIDSLPGESFVARQVEFATRADPATQTFRGRVAITPPDRSASAEVATYAEAAGGM